MSASVTPQQPSGCGCIILVLLGLAVAMICSSLQDNAYRQGYEDAQQGTGFYPPSER